MKQIGDTITLKVPKENSDWGYEPAPNGTKCTIVGFGDIAWGRTNNCGIPPGVYENRYSVNVKFTVKGIEQRASIGSFCFEERDIGRLSDKVKLSDLPETKFWEWDIVRPANGKPIFKEWGLNLKIQSIQWRWEKDKRGYCYMVESVDVPHSGSTYGCDSELELVKRGKVWDYYHKNPLTFQDVREESQFYSALGRTKEVRNPNVNLYTWTLDEAQGYCQSLQDRWEQSTL